MSIRCPLCGYWKDYPVGCGDLNCPFGFRDDQQREVEACIGRNLPAGWIDKYTASAPEREEDSKDETS